MYSLLAVLCSPQSKDGNNFICTFILYVLAQHITKQNDTQYENKSKSNFSVLHCNFIKVWHRNYVHRLAPKLCHVEFHTWISPHM